MMTIQEFIIKFRDAFGDAAPLPVSFAYSITPATDIKSVPKCMIGAVSKVQFICEKNAWHKCMCCESSFVHIFYCCFLYVNAARQQKKTANPPSAA